MSTAEKITMMVAMIGALGGGVLARSLVEHWMTRRERATSLSEKLVTMATATITRLEAENQRLRAELAGRQARPHAGDQDQGDGRLE